MAEEKKTTKKTTRKVEKAVPYENNPFFVALNGINLIFEKAKGVAILLIIVSILSVFSGGVSRSSDETRTNGPFAMPSWPAEQWLLILLISGIIILAFIFISAMLSGISAYTSARVAKGQSTSLSEAFHAVLDKLFSYIWLQIIVIVKTLLWTLLLIIPGIIMAYRYSLANIAFFDKDLRGNEAVKESLRLTKGAWLTTFASQVLFNMITLGVISEFVTAGAKAVLYRQLSALGSKEKPAAHTLSWLTLFLPFAIAFVFVMFILIIIGVVVALGLAHR